MDVESLMTREPECCFPTDSIHAAALKMRDAGVGMLPVVDGDRPVGVLTDRDVCLAVANRHEESDPFERLPVSSFMSRPAICCARGASPREALDTMREHGVRRLVVVDEIGAPCGVVALDDLAAESKPRVYEHVPSHTDVVEALRSVSRYHDLAVAGSATR